MANITRSQFVKGAAVGTAAVAAGAIAAPALADEAAITAETVSGKWAFEIAPDPIADDQISEVKEAEVIVVGAGTAGLCCAVSAAEAGAKVILFAMGSGPIGRGGSMFAFHSKFRESWGLEPVNPDPYLKAQMIQNQWNFDTDKWFKWAKYSEEAMNWLSDIMTEAGDCTPTLEQVQHGNCQDPNALEYTPIATHGWIREDIPSVGAGDGQPFVVANLAIKAEELGVELIYNMTAKQLVRGGVPNGTEGRVDAVIAQDKEGNYVKFVGSKAIVLATGDFARDKDMMMKYCPGAWHYFTNYDKGDDFDPEAGKVYGGLYKGDGQKMGLWVGAAWQKTFPNATMGGGFFSGADTIGMLLNSDGKRFAPEPQNFGQCFMLFPHVHKKWVFQIWDSDYAVNAAPWPKSKTAYGSELSTPEEKIAGWDATVERGFTPEMGGMVKADTIEEVIEKLGLPPETIDEVNKYNGFCDAGLDEDFHKNPLYLIPIKTPPFYGYAGIPRNIMHTVLGGLRTDINCKVCDANDEPIPGLYNVGSMIGDSYAGWYSFCIPGQNYGMNCVCYGYLTGKYIAENE
ncbi:MAG: FAD-dependent oxidoreductase [Coriobacteriales bacterium]|nr:FAD-dependent oxidoreductase [Coriobacteriales bacterium]